VPRCFELIEPIHDFKRAGNGTLAVVPVPEHGHQPISEEFVNKAFVRQHGGRKETQELVDVFECLLRTVRHLRKLREMPHIREQDGYLLVMRWSV
jgi:hypothetical protein